MTPIISVTVDTEVHMFSLKDCPCLGVIVYRWPVLKNVDNENGNTKRQINSE